MKLVTYRSKKVSEARIGVISNGQILDIFQLGLEIGFDFPISMLEFIDQGPDSLVALSEAMAEIENKRPPGLAIPSENGFLLAPIPVPRKHLFGIGLNYVEHVAESARSLDTSQELPTKPVVFSKPPTAVIGPGDGIQHNSKMTQQLDWEVELAVIIGKKATRIDKENAMSHVFGYSIMNDVSARDNRRAGQWIFSKGQDTFAPFGPCIVTADEIIDPHNLNLWLKKNNIEKQNSNTKHLLFDIPTLISDLSSGMSLEPGDIIATGTPSGVGAGRDPQEWMWPGDIIECGIDGIGVLKNPVVNI